MNPKESVVSSWNSAIERFSSGPLLFLPVNIQESDKDGNTTRLGLFSLKDKTTHDLNMVFKKSEDVIIAQNEDIRIVGSSHGWLIIVNKFGKLSLLNVLSSSCIELPTNDNSHSSAIAKAILTVNPSRDDTYKVIIIYGSRKMLAFYGCGDETWTIFSDSQGYDDLIWHNNMLYTLRKGVTIEGWDFNDSRLPTRKFYVQCCYTTSLSFARDCCTTQWYLIPVMREILFIVRYVGEFVNYEGELLCEGDLLSGEDSHPLVCPYRTFKFEVYKVDMVEKKLVEVRSLNDQVVFLGGNQGFSVSSGDCKELKANSIYFTDDYWDRMYEDYLYGGHDFGIFSLEDGSIDSIMECDFLQRYEPTPFWIMPNQNCS